jgi:hypothetical protein
VAEKYQAMVSLGELNSRMKDFYDLFILAGRFAFEGKSLAAAVQATFARRSTDMPLSEPIALRSEFADLRDKQVQWRAFARRTRLIDDSATLALVVSRIHAFLWPIVRSLRNEQPVPVRWSPGGPWS